MDNKQLDALVQAQAKQAGLTSKQALKALKKLREGGLMSQLAPQLQQTIESSNPTLSPRDKLRAKLNNAKQSRSTKETKMVNYEKQKEDVYKREKEEKDRKEKEKEAARRRRKAHAQKLRELEEKMGPVSDDVYLTALTRQRENVYGHESERNRDRNIVELYSKQQLFSDKINMDEMDELFIDSE